MRGRCGARGGARAFLAAAPPKRPGLCWRPWWGGMKGGTGRQHPARARCSLGGAITRRWRPGMGGARSTGRGGRRFCRAAKGLREGQAAGRQMLPGATPPAACRALQDRAVVPRAAFKAEQNSHATLAPHPDSCGFRQGHFPGKRGEILRGFPIPPRQSIPGLSASASDASAARSSGRGCGIRRHPRPRP